MILEHIPVTHAALQSEEIKQGVESLAQALEQGYTVYIHDKAGNGTAIVIAYLMQYHTLPYDEASNLVQNWHPNINKEQRQAILDYFNLDARISEASQISWVAAIQDYLSDYFQQANDITEERLAETLDRLFYYAVEGVEVSEMPASVAEWIPQMAIESTLSRRNRYLTEFAGDQNRATAEAISLNHTYFKRMQLMVLGMVPFVGSPASYSMNLWYQLREICLIAALHGHDLHDPEVKIKVMSALVGARGINMATKKVTKLIARKILIAAGARAVPGATIAVPLKTAFDYFTDNATKVADHAQALFAGEHSRLIE